MFDRALAEPRLSHLGESLETARRLYGVGNYVYCRDLVGYLLQQHPDVADTGVLRRIFDELEGLAVGPPAATQEVEDAPADDDDPTSEEEDDDRDPGEITDEFELPRRGAKVVHTLGTGVRVSPRSKPSGHFGGAAAREPTPAPEPAPEPIDETPVVRAIDPRPAPTPPPRRTMTPPEPSVEVEGRPVLPEWRPPPSQVRRDLPAPIALAAPPAAQPRAEIVRYEERPAATTVIEGAPARVAFAFGAGILLGALAVVVLMEHYQATVRSRFPAIATRPVIIRTPPPVYVPPPPPPPAPPAALSLAPPHSSPHAEAAPPVASAAGSADLFEPDAGIPAVVASASAGPELTTASPARAPPPKVASAPKAAVAAKAPPRAKVKAKAKAKAKRRPKSKKPAPTTAGRIVVETKPASRGKVTVKVDGKARGTAPLKLKIDPGVHEIQTLQGSGYPELRMVRVEPGGLARVVVPLAK